MILSLNGCIVLRATHLSVRLTPMAAWRVPKRVCNPGITYTFVSLEWLVLRIIFRWIRPVVGRFYVGWILTIYQQ
jgi:hypothetical protein